MSSILIFALWLVVAGAVTWSVWHSRLAYAASAAVLDASVRFHKWTRDVTGTPPWLAGILAAAGVVVAGVATTVAVMWPLGIAVAKLQASVDVPVFDYFHSPAHQVHWWTSSNLLLTQIGNRHPTEAVIIVAAIGFAVVRTERRWYRSWRSRLRT